MKQLFAWMVSSSLAFSVATLCAGWCNLARAQPSVKLLNASHPLYKLVGQVSVPHYPKNYGQGSFVGDDGCHVLTNYHVAFADGLDAEGQTKTLADPLVGSDVTFSYNPDDAGRFQNVIGGKVEAFGNFMFGAPRGRLGDLALIRLSECQMGIHPLKFDPTAVGKRIPTGKLSTLTAIRTSANENVVVSEEGCQAFHNTPVTGLIFSTCIAEGGTSANLLLSRTSDGTYQVVGIGSGHGPAVDGRTIAIGILASTIAKFLGESGIPVP